MDQKRLMLAIAISFVILFGYQFLAERYMPHPPPSPTPAASTAPAAACARAPAWSWPRCPAPAGTWC